MNIKVSVPVEAGGHTGQRDQWESFTSDFNVIIEDDGRVLLENTRSHTQPEKLWLDLDDLKEAVAFIQEKEVA